MCRVRSAATPMKISGEAMSSVPAEWCSPIHASSQPVEVLDQLEVPLEGQGRVLPGLVERSHEDAKAQTVGHGPHSCPSAAP
jgi:hypothetical protein